MKNKEDDRRELSLSYLIEIQEIPWFLISCEFEIKYRLFFKVNIIMKLYNPNQRYSVKLLCVFAYLIYQDKEKRVI